MKDVLICFAQISQEKMIMSRVVPAEEFDLIEQVISEHPEGIGISALEKALALHLPKVLNRRTLQRRLCGLGYVHKYINYYCQIRSGIMSPEFLIRPERNWITTIR